jgi:hypothetical protein
MNGIVISFKFSSDSSLPGVKKSIPAREPLLSYPEGVLANQEVVHDHHNYSE